MVTREQIEALAALAPQVEAAPAGKGSGRFDVKAFLDEHHIVVRQEKQNRERTVYELACCPFNAEHNHGEAFVKVMADGKIGAGCQHESCTWTWHQLREHFDPDAYATKDNGKQKAKPAPRSSVRPDEPVPAGPPVELAELLSDLETYYLRYIAFPLPEHVVVIVLWTVHTWIPEQAEQSPYLDVSSPEKQCGKSQVGKVASFVVRRPWVVITPSEAVVYRKIEQDFPTMLMDEVDAIFGGRSAGNFEPLRALLNAGNERGTVVPRTMAGGKGTFELQEFSVYCPKMLMGIGRLPATVTDRSIPIRMARKSRAQKVERLRKRGVEVVAAPLRARLSRWAASADVADARPDLPDELSDRQQDCWEPLLAIADEAGGTWPERARRAALVLSAGRSEESQSLGVRLLADVRTIFVSHGNPIGLPTQTILEALKAMEESPWPGLNDKGITPHPLARLLAPYGVKPGQHRFDGQSIKGYLLEDFRDPWERYLQPVTPPETAKDPKHRNNVPMCRENVEIANETGMVAVSIQNTASASVPAAQNMPSCRDLSEDDPTEAPGCFDVSDQNPDGEAGDAVAPIFRMPATSERQRI
jgi:hypothetical protein